MDMWWKKEKESLEEAFKKKEKPTGSAAQSCWVLGQGPSLFFLCDLGQVS